MKKIIITLFPLFPFIFSQWVVGVEKSPFFFSQIGVEDGLSQSTIKSIYQDTNGFLWLGTKGGLNRYDGYEFKVYKSNPLDTTSLVDNNVGYIGEDIDKNIWIITDNGLHKIENRTGKLKRYYVNETEHMHCGMRSHSGNFYLAGKNYIYRYDAEKDSLVLEDWLSAIPITSNIVGMKEDNEGTMYIATALSGLIVLNRDKEVMRHYRYDPDVPESLINGAVNELFIDSMNRLWILSETSGMCYLDKETDQFIHLTRENSVLSSNVVRAIAELDSGTLLIGTFSGLNSVHMQTLEVTHYGFDPEEVGSLSYYSVHSLLVDNTGGLWVGAWKGLNYHTDAKEQLYLIKPKEFTGLLGMGKEDEDGNLWFATEGAGLFCYNPETQSQELYPLKSSSEGNYGANIIKSLLVKGDSILCATNSGGVFLFSRKNKTYRLLYDWKHEDIYTLLSDSKGRLWIPTNTSSGLVVIDKGKQRNLFVVDGEERKFNFVTAIQEIEPDVFIMGTLTQGLYRYDMKNQTLKTFDSSGLNLPATTRLGAVSSILTDSENSWVSFFGSGVLQLDKEMNLIKHYTEKEGLGDSYIYTMVQDRNQSLWALTREGLYCLDKGSNHFFPVKNECCQALEYTMHAGTSDRNGTLYFPGNKGILCLNPIKKEQISYRPPVYLTNLAINNTPVEFDPFQPLKLASNETNVAIEYTAPDLISGRQNQYAYKMEGVENDWNYVKDRRVAYYSNLPPGRYQFKVKVANNKGVWNPQETLLSITVKPPLYKTWWACLLYIIGILSLIWKFISHQKLRHELESNIRFKQLEQEKTKELYEERIRLFTSFSHELRTPLTLLVNPLKDLLNHSSFSTEVKKTLQLMCKNTQRLLLLVNNLMDVQKYDSRKMVLQKEPFNLYSFIQEVFELFVPIARSRDIRFSLKNNFPVDYSVCYDRKEIEKVLFNLLSNAFKFTPEKGKIDWILSVYSREGNELILNWGQNETLVEDYYLHIEVSDNGTGTTPEEIEKIFQPFYHSSQDLHHQIAGSGIGLSLARFIVEQHNGIIGAENRESSGTKMHVLLPLEEKPVSSPVNPVEVYNPINLQELIKPEGKKTPAITQRILLVEDNKEVLDYLEKQLENEYKITKAGDGENALSQLAVKMPDLIISDVVMPVVDGVELCRQVKTTPELSHIPVILLTAKTMLSQIAEGYNVGADEYIIKPFDIALLKIRIRNLLNARTHIREKYEKKMDLKELGVKTSSADEEFLEQYTVIIKANFSNPKLDVDLVCKEIGMSRANFYRKVKTLTALSPAEIIKKLRLEAAAQMLRETDLSVTEILDKVAFSSNGYFAFCFKSMYGMSPKEYRQANTPRKKKK